MPSAIKISGLCSNYVLQGLLSSNQVLLVPPIVSDITEALPWILELDPLPSVNQSVATE